jgi:hypothetical protein
MPRLARRLIPLALALVVTQLVAACQVGQPGAGPAAETDVTPNAVTGDAIEVTALDAPPASGAVAGPDSGQVSGPGSGPDLAAPAAALAAGAEGAALPEGADPAAADATAVAAPQPELAAPEAVAEPPPPPKSESQLACEKRRGTWSRTGKGDLRICVFPTSDGGKRCTRESQCEGLCLARSGTCAPFKPLMGCNEIFQDNGARVTQCIE